MGEGAEGAGRGPRGGGVLVGAGRGGSPGGVGRARTCRAPGTGFKARGAPLGPSADPVALGAGRCPSRRLLRPLVEKETRSYTGHGEH